MVEYIGLDRTSVNAYSMRIKAILDLEHCLSHAPITIYNAWLISTVPSDNGLSDLVAAVYFDKTNI